MAEFNGNAIKSMMEEFPGTPIVLITTGNYILVNESSVHFPHLTRLNVQMANGDGCKLTNVRYGESDPDRRFYNEDHFATCVNIDFNQMRNYVGVYDGTFDVWAITSDIINAGQYVLTVASNRFDNAVKLSKYSFAEKGRRVNGWHMPSKVFPSTEPSVTEEKRRINLVLDLSVVGGAPNEWLGRLTTLKELMEYSVIDCPASVESRESAWAQGVAKVI